MVWISQSHGEYGQEDGYCTKRDPASSTTGVEVGRKESRKVDEHETPTLSFLFPGC
jgi:hypothetical protein